MLLEVCDLGFGTVVRCTMLLGLKAGYVSAVLQDC